MKNNVQSYSKKKMWLKIARVAISGRPASVAVALAGDFAILVNKFCKHSV